MDRTASKATRRLAIFFGSVFSTRCGTPLRCTVGLDQARFATAAGALFCLGIVLFSGNLYVFALAGELPVAGGAPVGGFCLIAAWVGFGFSAFVGVENNTRN